MEKSNVMTQRQVDRAKQRAWLRAAEQKRKWWPDTERVGYFYLRHWETGQLIGCIAYVRSNSCNGAPGLSWGYSVCREGDQFDRFQAKHGALDCLKVLPRGVPEGYAGAGPYAAILLRLSGNEGTRSAGWRRMRTAAMAMFGRLQGCPLKVVGDRLVNIAASAKLNEAED